MKEQRVTPLTESGLLAALLVVLGQAAVYLPVWGMVATLCWPLPLIVLVVRHGVRWGILGLLVAGVVMGLLIEPTLAARMVLAFGPTGLMLGLGFRRQWSGTKVFGAGLAGSIIAKLAALGLLFALTGINPWDTQLSLLRQSFEESFGLYGQLGVPEQDIATSRTQIEAGLQLVSMLLPLVVLVMGLMDTAVSYWLGGRVLRRLGHKVTAAFPSFRDWRLPRAFALLAGFALVGLYWGDSRAVGVLYDASLNVLLVSLLAGLVQGLALLSAIMRHFRLGGFARTLIYALVLFNGLFLQIVALTGLFDMFFDYRRRFHIGAPPAGDGDGK